ncbi:hypothetical protein DIPPA_21778 [Diplonema papillatum]|nr:hypothetical protein DIPPA_21778 [Diplonema papillatum]
MKMHAKMQKTRDELVGTHVEFFHAPSHLHHPDLVKAAVAQRMQDRHNYFHAADRPARLVGEASDAFLRMVGEKVGDLREHVSTEVDPALEKVYATRYCLQSVSDEKARAEKKSRAFGSTFSSMRANLGDPWLREVEKDTVPTSGRLFELYHKVAREAVGGATPENLVAEMFKAKGIHASLPFLRQWLLREPARNRSAISWPSFYSEIALAKDFILQAARGGADFGHYLTSTTDNLWGERQRKDRPSQASAMLAIAAQLIPLASSLANGGSDDEEDEESDEEREDRIADVAAGILPHALPLFRGNPPATRSEAKSQKKALLQALAKLREMLKSDGLEDEEEEETEEHSDDEMQLLRKE